MINIKEHFQLKKTSDSKQTEKELLASISNGNSDSFAFLYKKYVDELFSYGLSLGFNREETQDAIQDTFVKLHQKRRECKNIENIKSYLFRMLKNCLLDRYRSCKKEEVLDLNNLPFEMEISVLEEYIDKEEREFLEKYINQLLNKLTSRQKEAIYLRFFKELEYEDTAKILNMTPPAVRKLISRAIKRMRE